MQKLILDQNEDELHTKEPTVGSVTVFTKGCFGSERGMRLL